MRRLIDLIFAVRNRMLIIRQELPRTKMAGLVRGTYGINNMRVLLFVGFSVDMEDPQIVCFLWTGSSFACGSAPLVTSTYSVTRAIAKQESVSSFMGNRRPLSRFSIMTNG